MSQAHQDGPRTFVDALRAKLTDVATAMGQIWEGYKQTPTAC